MKAAKQKLIPGQANIELARQAIAFLRKSAACQTAELAYRRAQVDAEQARRELHDTFGQEVFVQIFGEQSRNDFSHTHPRGPSRQRGGKTKRRAHGSFVADCTEAVKRLGKRTVTAKAVMEMLKSMNVSHHANQVYKTLSGMSNLQITSKRTKKKGTRGRASAVYKKVKGKKE